MAVVPIFFVISLLVRVQFVMPALDEGLLGGFGKLTDDESPNLNFQTNLQTLLDTFAFHASTTGFHNSTFGEGPDQVHGLYMCRGDINSRECTDCVSRAKDTILTVTGDNNPRRNFFEHVMWHDRCMVRYSNKSFLGEMDTTTWSSAVLSRLDGPWNRIRFAKVLGDTMNQLAIQAANNGSGLLNKFATKTVNLTRDESLYATVQCTWDLTPSDCHKCLTNAIRQLLYVNKYRRSSGRALYSNCMVSYETPLLFNTTRKALNLSFVVKNNTISSLNGPRQGDAEVM